MSKERVEDAKNDMAVFSVRLEAEQKERIEEAAAAVGSTAGGFMRDAAFSRAIEVLNSAGQQGTHLRELARRVVGHVVEARVSMKQGRDGQSVGLVVSELYKPSWVRSEAEELSDDPDAGQWVSVLDCEAKGAMRRALETAGGEFARLLVQEWDRWGRQGVEYKPRFAKKEIPGPNGE